MKLHWSPRSPFVRKVMIVLHETGQLKDVELVRSVVAVHMPPNSAVIAVNPLGKIPVLITGELGALFDSRVICEYLDGRAQGGLFPSDPAQRMAQLRWQALADGLTDILLLWRTELTRESGPWPAITEGWHEKVESSMQVLEAEMGENGNIPFGIGQIALICALGQLDFRWPDCAWREHFPALASLENKLSRRGSIEATQIVNDDTSSAPDVTAGQLRFGQQQRAAE